MWNSIFISLIVSIFFFHEAYAGRKICWSACDWNSWGSWSSCSTKCGRGDQSRARSLCCWAAQTYNECMRSCKKSESSTYESRKCNTQCYNNGNVNSYSYECNCQNGYYGSCCEKYQSCGSWGSCTRSCGGGKQTKTCRRYDNGWNEWTESMNCNEFCYNGASYRYGSCSCPSWRSGACCENCREISISHCMPGRQECGGSPDGIRCTQCYLPYKPAGYNQGCVRIPCNDRNGMCDHNCMTQWGTPTCSCRSGYQLSSNGYSCNDINECQVGSSKCEHICTNTEGSFSCSCRTGYQLNYDARTCSDIDECVSADLKCSQVCLNKGGSYACSCDPGFVLLDDKRSCEDIDECSISNGNCSHRCQNIPGSYQCNCPSGFQLQTQSTVCIDIDECKLGTSSCSQECNNTDGSFVCGCRDGFVLHTDGETCTDIDDCANVTCHHGGVCTDNLGSYTCSCDSGFSGQHCELDIDECVGFLNAGCEDLCINTEGSFRCACTGNKTIQDDGFTCSGLNDQSSNFFARNEMSNDTLPKGCSYITFTQCNIILSSTSLWYRLKNNQNVAYTFGIVFAEVETLCLPISISGLQVDQTTMRILSGSLQYSPKDGEVTGMERSYNCLSFEITPRDMHDILQSSAFLKTFFHNIHSVLPTWIQLSKTGRQILSMSEAKIEIKTGEEINTGICKGAPLVASRVYSLLKLRERFSVEIYGQELYLPDPFRNESYCIVTDLCQDNGHTIFIILPTESRDILNNISMFESLINSTGLYIRPIGIGLSLERSMVVNFKTSETDFWQGGETTVTYPLMQSANVWVGGETDLHYNGLSLSGRAEAFVAVPNIRSMLKSMFMDEWHLGANITVTSLKYELQISGKSETIDFRPQGDVILYGSLGGTMERKWCGKRANPSGFFFKFIQSSNPFWSIPILNFLGINANTLVNAFVFSKTTTLVSNSDKVKIINNILTLKQATERYVTDTITFVFKYVSLLSDQSVSLLKTLNQTANRMMNSFENLSKVLQTSTDPKVLLDAAKGVSDIWNDEMDILRKETHTFIQSIKRNNFSLKYNFPGMVLKSFNDIETDIGRIVDQMVCDVGKVLNLKHGFGLKLYADIGFFGMQFVGMDVDMVFGTSRELEQCNKYEFVHTFTSDENVVRILGVGKVMVKLGRFLLAHGGLGVGVSLSLDNTLKFYIIFRAEASLLGLKSSVEVHIGTSGLHFFMEGNIWNIYKAKLRVSKELFLNLKNCREISLEGMALKVKGQFVADADGDGDFSDGYVHALIRFTERFRDETIDRLSDVQNAFTEAQRGLTSAQNWLESQKAVVRSAHKDFDDAVRSMEVAKVKLEEAKKPFQNAIDRLNEAQRKVDRLCRIKTCQNICIPGIECRIRNYNVLGAQFRFPCCSPTNCMFTIPDIICELANVGCYIVRGLAYAVLEIAKIAVRIPMLILDAAKVIVSAAQVFVDKSRVVLDIAEGAISFAQLGLEGAKWVLEGAKYALEAVKVVVKLGVMVVNFVIKYGLQMLIDVRNCGFEIELSTRDLPIFGVGCEINLFMTGFHKVGIYINFNDPVQSLWRAAKGSVEMTLQAIDEEKTNMKKRDIRNTALNGMYKAMRMPRDAEMHDGDLDMLVNFTFQYIEDNAFENHTDGNMDEYTYWKQIYAEKCLQFTRCHTFLLDTTVILSQLVNDTAATIRNISSIQDNMQSFNIESISNNLSFASIGIDPTVAQDEFNISMATLEDTIEGARGNLSYDPLLTNIVAFADESRKFLEDKVGSVNNIMSLNLWIAAMNDVTKEYFHNDTCVSFLDCAHYAVAVLYQQFVAVNVINQSESTDTISEFEDTFLLLVGNNSHTIQDLDSMATSLILTLQRMREHDVFCSKPPEMVEPLRNQTAKSGTDISLICNATGDPDPDFWWYKDGKLMPNHHKMILTMSNASEEDAATYYCVAGNLVANYSFEEVHVFVQKEILHDNGFYKKDDGPNLPLERILAPILGIATCAIVIGLVVWKFRKRTVVSKGSSASNTQAVCEE